NPLKKRLRGLETDLYSLENQILLFEESPKEKKARERKISQLRNEIDKLRPQLEEIESGKIYHNAFEWRFEFPEVLDDKGNFIGFDVVIGNPPWGAKIDNKHLTKIKEKNSDIIVRMIDSFMFFVNLTFSIKSQYGLICQIIPDVILYQVDNEKLREKIFKTHQLEIAFNLGDRIFEDVARPCCIILLTSKFTNISWVGEYQKSSDDSVNSLSHNLLIPIETSFFKTIPNQVITTKNLIGYKIINRYNKIKLRDLIDQDGIQRGVSPDLKEAFIVDKKNIDKFHLEQNFIFPTITGGRDLNKYLISDIDKKIIYTKKTDDPQLIPQIIEYLKSFKERITCVEVKENKHPFWSLHRPRNQEIFLKPEKIIGVITGDKIIVALDNNQIFPTDGLYLMSSSGRLSNKFLLGVLNSKIITYFYRLLSMEVNRTLAQIKPTILEEVPIETHPETLVKKIEIKVDQILTAKKSNPKADTSELEKEIDKIVYELYGLSEEEIGIIEGEIK
ncbi:TaqI-like C-terminal specificity domain-containing protein, partial [Microcystis sp. M49636_WE2]